MSENDGLQLRRLQRMPLQKRMYQREPQQSPIGRQDEEPVCFPETQPVPGRRSGEDYQRRGDPAAGEPEYPIRGKLW